MSEDFFSDENIQEESTELHFGADNVPAKLVAFTCDNCNYKWEAPVKPELEGDLESGRGIDFDSSSIRCPMCGSDDVDYMEA